VWKLRNILKQPYASGAQIPGTRSPQQLNSVEWCLMFVGSKQGCGVGVVESESEGILGGAGVGFGVGVSKNVLTLTPNSI
jgi:hypothetical protein